MPYATGADLVLRFDHDLVGDLATDDRETQTRANVIDHPVVLMALLEAEGQINAALRYGNKYKAGDLEGLTGSGLEYLKGLVCDLTMSRLFNRRPESCPENADAIRDRAMLLIDKLRGGENIFDLPANIDATLIDHSGPNALDLDARADMTTRMGPYFPPPVTRLPKSQGGR